ncbi:hypothetical protein M2302_005367 [Micromonospora sp. A200]|uniref:hypothetical protein n=1 Tax=Micromonospora sp. A200 TaxID=2940568 RepID=UPI002475F4B1|nr:hypothetical protein [Micromonospora sp. A200]MDH6465166.1 hypothetical protein [Micromonospora sp. A200]
MPPGLAGTCGTGPAEWPVGDGPSSPPETLLTIGYLVSRGLTKPGSRSRDDDPRTNH